MEVLSRKDIQSIIDRVYPSIVKDLGKSKYVKTPVVEIHHNIYVRLSGIDGSEGTANPHAEYERSSNKIFLYTPKMDSEEQVIRSLIHEYTHALQDPKSVEKYSKLKYQDNPNEQESERAEKDWKKYI